MPRYYFDTDDNGDFLMDDEGTDLPDIRSAQREAAQALTSMAKDHIPDDRPQRDMAINVRARDGKHLFRVSLSFKTEPPAPDVRVASSL